MTNKSQTLTANIVTSTSVWAYEALEGISEALHLSAFCTASRWCWISWSGCPSEAIACKAMFLLHMCSVFTTFVFEHVFLEYEGKGIRIDFHENSLNRDLAKLHHPRTERYSNDSLVFSITVTTTNAPVKASHGRMQEQAVVSFFKYESLIWRR